MFKRRKVFVNIKVILRLLTVILLLSSIVSTAAGCGSKISSVQKPARYGEEGAALARKLAGQFPRRTPGSDQEKQAADWIAAELDKYGYETEIQQFSYETAAGVKSSQNVIARLAGSGFNYETVFARDHDAAAPQRLDDIIMVLGAHYDMPALQSYAAAGLSQETTTTEPVSTEPEETEPEETTTITATTITTPAAAAAATADGIHNNASGVAALLYTAKKMREIKPGYDIIFCFFGAGTEKYQGARAFLQQLDPSVKKRITNMINIGPIYAGDKIYAHAGQNSVSGGSSKVYNMRHKLYQVTDVFFENTLYTNNRYAVYTNQNGLVMPAASGKTGVYREWTTRLSDHTPFDEAGIEVVYLESGDYNGKPTELGLESKLPVFGKNGGMISGTNLDSTEFLEKLFVQIEEKIKARTLPALETAGVNTTTTKASFTRTTEESQEAQLAMRINNTVFIILEVARRGPVNYVLAKE